MVKNIPAATKKNNSAHALRLGWPWCETNYDILRLPAYRFIYEKIENNRISIPSKCRAFDAQKLRRISKLPIKKNQQSRSIKTVKSRKPSLKLILTAV